MTKKYLIDVHDNQGLLLKYRLLLKGPPEGPVGISAFVWQYEVEYFAKSLWVS